MDYLTGITGRQVLGSLLFVCLFLCCFVFPAAGADGISCDLLCSQFSDSPADYGIDHLQYPFDDNGDPSWGSPENLTPTMTTSKTTPEICVEFAKGNIGQSNHFYLVGYAIKDCDGYIETNISYDGSERIMSWHNDHHTAQIIDLSETKLNCNEPFKKVVLYFILVRHWGYSLYYDRYDKITLDVTEYITSIDEGKNTFSFDVKQDYVVGATDRIDIYDLQGNILAHFPKTHEDGWHGSFDLVTPEIRGEFAKGDIGQCNFLYIAGYAIKDCDGYIETNIYDYHTDFKEFASWSEYYHDIQNIDLSNSKLNCNKPFKKVVLYFILKRSWGFLLWYDRCDKFTLDVTKYITSTDKGKNTFSFDVKQDYVVDATDRIDIYDLQGNILAHFPKTHEDGWHGSFDLVTPEICVEFAKGDIGSGECNALYFAGYAIKDCDGYIETNIYNYTDLLADWTEHSYNIINIDLSNSKLNCNEKFKKVVLYFILKRSWGFSLWYDRYDKITLDVTEYITSADKGKNTFSFDVKQDYVVGATDRIDIYDLQGNILAHFPKTHEDGWHGSFDPIS